MYPGACEMAKAADDQRLGVPRVADPYSPHPKEYTSNGAAKATPSDWPT
jgi:hypothetical protein